MLQNNEFIVALENNGFISSVIENGSFSKVNINQFDYEKLWDDHYKFKKFQLGPWQFDYFEVSLTNENIWMTFVLNDSAFINSLPFILGKGPTIETDSQLINNKRFIETRTKVGKVNLKKRVARVSYLISDSFGAAIKVNILSNPSI